jgi:hypothetical protein
LTEENNRRCTDKGFEEQIVQLRIEVAVLKAKLNDADKAVTVASSNTWAVINTLLSIMAIIAAVGAYFHNG